MVRPGTAFQNPKSARPSNRCSLLQVKGGHREGEKRDAEQEKRRIRGFGVVERLDVIVNGNRNGARNPGNVAPDHQDDAKFPERVSKREDEKGEKQGTG